jgi:hypothetical protein
MILYPSLQHERKIDEWLYLNVVATFPCACKGPMKQLYNSINMLDRIKQWLTPCGVYEVVDVNFFEPC